MFYDLVSSCATGQSFANYNVEKPFSDYLTPMIYGAVGDGNNKGVSLFKSEITRGSLERVCVVGKRNSDVRFFDQCDCNGKKKNKINTFN